MLNKSPENWQVPDNMKYLFEGETELLTAETLDTVNQLDKRAKKLEENHWAIYPGLTSSAVYWIRLAFKEGVGLNINAVNKVIERLKDVHVPSILE